MFLVNSFKKKVHHKPVSVGIPVLEVAVSKGGVRYPDIGVSLMKQKGRKGKYFWAMRNYLDLILIAQGQDRIHQDLVALLPIVRGVVLQSPDGVGFDDFAIVDEGVFHKAPVYGRIGIKQEQEVRFHGG